MKNLNLQLKLTNRYTCSRLSGKRLNVVTKFEHRICVHTKLAFFDSAISSNKQVNSVFVDCCGQIAYLNTITRPDIPFASPAASQQQTKTSHNVQKPTCIR